MSQHSNPDINHATQQQHSTNVYSIRRTAGSDNLIVVLWEPGNREVIVTGDDDWDDPYYLALSTDEARKLRDVLANILILKDGTS